MGWVIRVVRTLENQVSRKGRLGEHSWVEIMRRTQNAHQLIIFPALHHPL